MAFPVVASDANTSLVYQAGSRDGEFWITFSASRDRTPFAVGFLRRRNARALHVVANADHWFQTLDPSLVQGAIAAYRPKGDIKCIGLGASMGGFGALSWANILALETVIVSAPQVIVDDVECQGIDDRWIGEWRALKASGILTITNAARELENVKVTAFFDPFDVEDRWHIDHLLSGPTTNLVAVPFCGHSPFKSLHDACVLDEVLVAAAEDRACDIEKMLHTYRRDKKNRYSYYCGLGRALLRSGRRTAARNVLAAATRRWPDAHDAYYYLSLLHEAEGDLRLALSAAYESAARARVEADWSLYEHVAHLHGRRGDLFGAETAFRLGLARFPESGLLRARFANFIVETLPERREEARRIIRGALDGEVADGTARQQINEVAAIVLA